MKTIKLNNGMETIVDDLDFDELSKHNWLYHQGYATRWEKSNGKGKVKLIRMQTDILGPLPEGLNADHRSTDKLDNRRSNLRAATKAQNAQNAGKPKTNTSGEKGVSWHKAANKWQVKVRAFGIQHYFGLFTDMKKAIEVHTQAIKQLHGEFARR